MKGKSATNAVHIIKQIIEKTNDNKMEIDMMFIDFKQQLLIQ